MQTLAVLAVAVLAREWCVAAEPILDPPTIALGLVLLLKMLILLGCAIGRLTAPLASFLLLLLLLVLVSSGCVVFAAALMISAIGVGIFVIRILGIFVVRVPSNGRHLVRLLLKVLIGICRQLLLLGW